MSTPVHVQLHSGSRPGGLSGHDLMSLFPPPQSTPSYPSSPFGREEREYLSSRRDEHARLRMRTAKYDDSSSSSGSGSETTSASSFASPPPHASSSRTQRTQRPASTKAATPTPPAPRRTAANYQTQVHLDQGSGDSQFHVMRMSLASMSNNSTPDCHFSEFRATQYPSRTQGKTKRP